MDYIPNTIAERQQMLAAMGLESMDELFADIPRPLRQREETDLPEPMTEMELQQHMEALAAQNQLGICFLGAGVYDHYIPSIVGQLAGRQEFYTAYTPYQPEISQGTLQAIFEYQSMICRLSGMDVSNASMYDGSTALAEAVSMACTHTKRSAVIVPDTLNPQWRAVLSTYLRYAGISIRLMPCKEGRMEPDEVAKLLGDDIAAVIVPSPNFFGLIERTSALAEVAHEKGALLISCLDPISVGVLATPGSLGADIVVGDGQALGNPMAYGGPHLGFLAAREQFLRRMPGRICGETVDKQGKRGFVLTMQTREQHIRREKATSNICTNQALCALRATIYLSSLGERGLAEVANLCLQKSHAAHEALMSTGLFEPLFDGPFFKEFALRYSGSVRRLNEGLLRNGVIGGYRLQNDYPLIKHGYMVAVTERRTAADIAQFAALVVDHS